MNCFKSWPSSWLMLAITTTLLAAGCRRQPASSEAVRVPPVDPLTFVLIPHPGTLKLDLQIRQVQQQLRLGKQPELALERLGWLFVRKARESFDPGFYNLAESCARALEARA